MRRLIFLLLLISFTSCLERTSLLNYRGCVIIAKSEGSYGDYKTVGLRYYNNKIKAYEILYIECPNMEIENLNIGDTIK